jgi:hypothetical protein
MCQYGISWKPEIGQSTDHKTYIVCVSLGTLPVVLVYSTTNLEATLQDFSALWIQPWLLMQCDRNLQAEDSWQQRLTF